MINLNNNIRYYRVQFVNFILSKTESNSNFLLE